MYLLVSLLIFLAKFINHGFFMRFTYMYTRFSTVSDQDDHIFLPLELIFGIICAIIVICLLLVCIICVLLRWKSLKRR